MSQQCVLRSYFALFFIKILVAIFLVCFDIASNIFQAVGFQPVVNSDQDIVDLHILRTSFCQRSNVSHRQNSLLYERSKEHVFFYEEVVSFKYLCRHQEIYVQLYQDIMSNLLLLSKVVPTGQMSENTCTKFANTRNWLFFLQKIKVIKT